MEKDKTPYFPGFFTAIRRQVKIVIAIPVFVTATAALVAFTLPDVYEAEAVLEIGRIMDIIIEPPVVVQTEMTNLSYLGGVAKRLGWDEKPVELAGMVKPELLYVDAEEKHYSAAMVIRVSGSDPGKTAALARALTADIVKEHRTVFDHDWRVHEEQVREDRAGIERLQAEAASGRAELERLVASGRVGQVEMAYLAAYVKAKEEQILNIQQKDYEIRRQLYSESITRPTRVMVEPEVPQTPVGPHRLRIVIGSFVGSLLLAAIVAFIIEQLQGKPERAAAPAGEKKEGP